MKKPSRKQPILLSKVARKTLVKHDTIVVPRETPPEFMMKDMDAVMRKEGVKHKVSYIDYSDPSATHTVRRKRRFTDPHTGETRWEWVNVTKPGRKAYYNELIYANTRENPSKGELITHEEYAAMAERQRKIRKMKVKQGVIKRKKPMTLLQAMGIKPSK